VGEEQDWRRHQAEPLGRLHEPFRHSIPLHLARAKYVENRHVR